MFRRSRKLQLVRSVCVCRVMQGTSDGMRVEEILMFAIALGRESKS